MLNLVREKVRSLLAEHPDAKIISISQPDNGTAQKPCMCAECQKIYAEEGAYSGAMIRFVNTIAREFAALAGRELQALPTADLAAYEALPALDIKIEDDDCLRYSGIKFDNVSVTVSPMNMRIRLYYCGLRAINFLADMTNYLMLEMGQPMHAFDSRKVDKLRIKKFAQPFTFQTLDQVERNIDENTLMICNGDVPVAIAGIMGGLDSEIVADTTSMTLESACFDPVSVRKSSARLAHRTDASQRYE